MKVQPSSLALVIEKTILDFERNGLGLDEEKRERIKEIKQGKRLSGP
jgi:Zn-dependent oligopeptidase